MKPGRNDPCHCGSGKKYKKCHEGADAAKESAELADLQAKAEEARAAEEAEAEADPKAAAAKAAAAKKATSRNDGSAGHRPKERIATAANPIRRKAV
jgi:hypothetical protein